MVQVDLLPSPTPPSQPLGHVQPPLALAQGVLFEVVR